jgi:hypothetical protein
MQKQLICRFLMLLSLFLIFQFSSATQAVLADFNENSSQEQDSGEPDQGCNDSLENDAMVPEQKLDTDLQDNQDLFNENITAVDGGCPDSDLVQPEVQPEVQVRSVPKEEPAAESSYSEAPKESLLIETSVSAADSQPEAEDGYVLIRTVEELIAVNNGLDNDYRLGNDLILPGIDSWTPIGASDNPFKGVFDGFDFTISGLFMNGGLDYSGLFGYTSGATIKNLNLDIAQVTGGDFTGGLVGRADSSTISNCTVEISNQPTGVVSGNQNVGGLVGYAEDTVIESSSASGSVKARDNYAGGLVGYQDKGTIYQSFSETQVVGEKNFVGGLVGVSKSATIEESYADSAVSGESGVGGLVGYLSLAGGSTINNSYAAGSVISPGSVGGLVGAVGKDNQLINCHSVTAVNPGRGNTDSGGLVGSSHSSSSSSSLNNFWDLDASGLETSAIGLGLTGQQMREAASFTSFDFAEIWYLDHLLAHPILKWQISEEPPGPQNPEEPGEGQGSGDELPLVNLTGGAVFSSHAYPELPLPSVFFNSVFYRQLLRRVEQLEMLIADLKKGAVPEPDQTVIFIAAEIDYLSELIVTYVHLLSEHEIVDLAKRLEFLTLAVKQL